MQRQIERKDEKTLVNIDIWIPCDYVLLKLVLIPRVSSYSGKSTGKLCLGRTYPLLLWTFL